MVYVVDPDKHLDITRKQLDMLLAEIELSHVTNVHVVYNMQKQSDFYPIYLKENGSQQLKHYFDGQVCIGDLKNARPDCEFSSHLIDLLAERD